ncbi:MAG: YbaK/EbsC family protein [Paracoccaceae bacterium]
MSKSVGRVEAEAESLGLRIEVTRLDAGTLTAQQAADAVGCDVDQIIKSVILREVGGGEHFLFLTAGGNRVDFEKASRVAGAELEKADAASIRAFTGFAIGGVSPLGHIRPIRTFMDPKILTFGAIWAAAGTPHHVFEIAPQALRAAIGPEVCDFTA